MATTPQPSTAVQAARRINVWYTVLTLVFGLFLLRAFYVQVIRYGHYHAAALSDQLKQYEVPASRGIIKAYDGSTIVPIVLNQKLYTIYADPSFIKDPSKMAAQVAGLIGGKASDYEAKMKLDTRYIVLARKVPADKKSSLLAKEYPGIGAQQQDYRTYPQGTLAAQLLGFVNNSGQGTYGIEQDLNKDLAGSSGELKAITDARGVPLAASNDNFEKLPQSGKDVVLTIDIGLQKQVEKLLADGVHNAKAPSGSAVVLDAHTGAIKAMANYPSYDPANYGNVDDASVFNNAAITHPIEIGSIMKSLTTAAALDKGVIQPNTTYYDPSTFKVDGFNITNIEEDGGAGTRSISQLLNLSLNTGATWELMQMGGGQLNKQARETWYDYMTNHYRFGKQTGVEQGYESPGYVPSPENNGAGINLTYANTAFGQAMTATTLQAAAALAGVVNGGTYYRPHLVAEMVDPSGKSAVTKPEVLVHDVVSSKVSQEMIPLMQYVVNNHSFARSFDQAHYTVGGKTGTAQIAKPTGGYYDNDFNGTYLGFVGGNQPDYVIAVFINRPKIGGYAGTAAAQPLFGTIAHLLIDTGRVAPKS